MRKTKTSSAVKNRYNAKAYDRITVCVPKGDKSVIEARAKELGKSTNAYIKDLIYTEMQNK